jgi:hypothetical protein
MHHLQHNIYYVVHASSCNVFAHHRRELRVQRQIRKLRWPLCGQPHVLTRLLQPLRHTSSAASPLPLLLLLLRGLTHQHTQRHLHCGLRLREGSHTFKWLGAVPAATHQGQKRPAHALIAEEVSTMEHRLHLWGRQKRRENNVHKSTFLAFAAPLCDVDHFVAGNKQVVELFQARRCAKYFRHLSHTHTHTHTFAIRAI